MSLLDSNCGKEYGTVGVVLFRESLAYYRHDELAKVEPVHFFDICLGNGTPHFSQFRTNITKTLFIYY